MKILIFGASGLTGLQLTQQAVEKGHQATAFVRTPENFHLQNPNLTVFKGDVTDVDAVEHSIENQDAVICALGAKTPFISDPALIAGINNIVNAMKSKAVKRFVYLSFIGVDDNKKGFGFLANYIMPLILEKATQDHKTKEKIIESSDLDWTIVRAPKLTNGKFTGEYRVGESILSNSLLFTISRKDLAQFMLSVAEQNQYIKQKPRIMY
ncbi:MULTISPECIES: NAD(P)-dependent oxidoreductase [Flavobacterium]|uniref:NAD(P)-dependent oxidoreductase n=1 Tax=Flavobacterium TaxID=237 RepID=UPI001FCA889E|nr:MULTISPECIES: SDR family oxidoreductase [Flavobacterium]UOK41848.1 SDR family oxidoreductase [Flavobacterium enshiense]